MAHFLGERLAGDRGESPRGGLGRDALGALADENCAAGDDLGLGGEGLVQGGGDTAIGQGGAGEQRGGQGGDGLIVIYYNA